MRYHVYRQQKRLTRIDNLTNKNRQNHNLANLLYGGSKREAERNVEKRYHMTVWND